MIEKYGNYRTEDFILDENFKTWVLNPRKETDNFWGEFLRNYPEKRKYAEEAAFIIKSLQPVEEEIPAGRLETIFNRINGAPEYKIARRKKKIVATVLKFAAVFILLAGITFFLYLLVQPGHKLLIATIDPSDVEKGQVILSDGTVYEFETKETIIKQTTKGEILINRDTLSRTQRLKTEPTAMNQVIVPYGKRSELVLSDGTRIWLNSGSQISYNGEFSGNTREVHLSGEAFFDVAPDNSKPFFVITRGVKIRVLGTRFNVTAYSDDKTISTALMSGKVSVGRNTRFARSMDLIAGEKIVFDRDDESFLKEKADLQFINSWTQGYLIFRNEPTTGIFRRLERYYNRPVIIEGNLDNISFSGKLDLRDDLKDVLENIAFASSLTIMHEDNYFVVKQNAYDYKQD